MAVDMTSQQALLAIIAANGVIFSAWQCILTPQLHDFLGLGCPGDRRAFSLFSHTWLHMKTSLAKTLVFTCPVGRTMWRKTVFWPSRYPAYECWTWLTASFTHLRPQHFRRNMQSLALMGTLLTMRLGYSAGDLVLLTLGSAFCGAVAHHLCAGGMVLGASNVAAGFMTAAALPALNPMGHAYCGLLPIRLAVLSRWSHGIYDDVTKLDAKDGRAHAWHLGGHAAGALYTVWRTFRGRRRRNEDVCAMDVAVEGKQDGQKVESDAERGEEIVNSGSDWEDLDLISQGVLGPKVQRDEM